MFEKEDGQEEEEEEEEECQFYINIFRYRQARGK
jgi:hypothetical protein